MRFILRLAVAALVANVTWHAWVVSSSFYKFRDALQTSSQTLTTKSDTEVRGQVQELATLYDVPLPDDSIRIRRDFHQVFIDGSYTKNVDVVPGVTFPWTFEIHVDSSYGNPISMKDVGPAGKQLLPQKPQRNLPQ